MIVCTNYMIYLTVIEKNEHLYVKESCQFKYMVGRKWDGVNGKGGGGEGSGSRWM